MTLILLLLACGGKLGDSACATHDPPLDWENFGAGFMASNCNGCHHSLLLEGARSGAPLGVDFDTLGGVVAWEDAIRERATPEDATMPPSGALSEDERALLAEWLECGL